MYKININNNTLFLSSTEALAKEDASNYDMVAAYTGKTKMLLTYIDLLEKTNRIKKLLIHFADVKKLKRDFESLFLIIKASGGIVEEVTGDILMIFRRGHWDLPKGKIDPGEKKKAAAIREVMEETGVKDLEILNRIMTTRHSYKLRSRRRVLKKTFWYAMRTHRQKLVPETSEDIEKAKWVNPAKFVTKDLPIYSNIIDVLQHSGHFVKGPGFF